MDPTADFQTAFRRAKDLHSRGRLTEAERAYRELATSGVHRQTVLSALVELYLQAGRPFDAIGPLVVLTEEAPNDLYFYARLAALLDRLGQREEAIRHYQRLLKREPRIAAAHFNLALLYKKEKRYTEALASYDQAIQLGISHVEEVYSNIGVLYSEMRKAEKAGEMYERALEVNNGYIPALFNRAALFEEAGERKLALDSYRRILAINPKHWESLARLAHVNRVTSDEVHLIDQLNRAIEEARDDRLALEALYFALAKIRDDLGHYDEAFPTYSAANELGKLRNPPYDRQGTEQAFKRLIQLYDPAWIESATPESSAAPIFICGMFRSGSTLIEQILAGHPSVTGGGELDLLPWLIARRLAPYPDRIRSVSRSEREQLGEEYLARLRDLFADVQNITDKRPDNFLHLGLIKVLFPRARIIYTRRDPLDNCLSLYFQQLGGNLSYATDLEDTAHYYRQHELLMAHWMASFGDSIFTVDYDELVHSPQPLVRRLLEFLGLEWNDGCLAFQRTDSLVKTASVWQVRQEMHSRSSGRWQNYEKFVPAGVRRWI
jgi:tetratricopeptide (TPR) repeat protein